MSSLTIVTDSTADIPPELRKKLKIVMVPLNVGFDDEDYLDQVTISSEDFYKKMVEGNSLPKTSQPAPHRYYETFKQLTDKGKQVIAILLSAQMSGSYQSATIAKSMLEQEANVTIINSRSASYGYGGIVVKAAEMVLDGAKKEEILSEIKHLRSCLQLYFVVDSLSYLQKGGRIGKAASLVGSLLNIKPILSIDDQGVIFPFEKVRSQKRAFTRICTLLYEKVKDKPVSLGLVVTPGYGDHVRDLIQMLESRLNIQSTVKSNIGAVIGTHAGPGTIGIFIWEQKR